MPLAPKDCMQQAKRLVYSWEALAVVVIALAGAASLVGAHFLIRW